jgi:hypothetical protein
MDGPVANDQGNDHIRILRVSSPWPAWTKKALRTSLDRGTFEDIRVTVPSGPESTEQPMYFAGAVDETVGASISYRKPPDYSQRELMINGGSPVCQSESTTQEVKTSLTTLVTNSHGRFLAPDTS